MAKRREQVMRLRSLRSRADVTYYHARRIKSSGRMSTSYLYSPGSHRRRIAVVFLLFGFTLRP